MPRRMISLIAWLLAAYGLFVAALYIGQRRFLYVPDTSRPSPATFGVSDMAPVTLRTSDGLDLLAWWAPPDRPEAPVMLYLHGNGGHIGHRGFKARPYLERGWGVLLLSWRGYGGNPGTPSEDGLYRDAEAGLAFLRAEGASGEDIVLYGESLGSGPAVKLATEHDVGALVLEAPFTSIPDLAVRMFPYVPVRPLVRDRFASVDRIAEVRAPLLVLHGERDATVPIAHGRRLLDLATSEKAGHFIPDAGHNDLYEFGAAEVVIGFVVTTIGQVKM